MIYNLPADHIAEVSLIGTGGGYGESCVIHYGNKKWAVVDSCIDPSSSECLPLSYLKKIGVNIATDVCMIICTHWHDDHIKGLSQLVKECQCADMFFARASDKRKFLYLVSRDYQKVNNDRTLTSTKEFVKCLEILTTRDSKVVQITPDRLLDKIVSLNVSIYSLSPSDYVLEQYDREIAELIDNYGNPNEKIILERPNNKSVALFFEFGSHCAILGADLEATTDSRKGWLNILDYSKVVVGKKASLFKIPHHGSKNGYHDRIWIELLDNFPTSKLTPWNLNRGLPESEMLRLYSEKTDRLFITAPIINKSKPIKRDKNFNKIIELFQIKLSEVKYSFGLIRSRIDISNEQSRWDTETAGEGFKIEA